MESAVADDCGSAEGIGVKSKTEEKLISDDKHFLDKIGYSVENSGVECKKSLGNNSGKDVSNTLSDASSTDSKIGRKRKLLDTIRNKTDIKNGSDAKGNSELSTKTSLVHVGLGKVNNVGDTVSGKKNLDDNSVTTQSKSGRKKKSVEHSDRSTDENAHSSHRDTLVTESNTEKTLIMNIKSEPIEDETLHMSCDEVDASSEVSKVTSGFPQAKRGRGRPRKSPFSSYIRTVNNKTTDYELPSTKAKGKDDVKSGSSTSSSEHLRGGIKRGRGRPRKSDSSVPIGNSLKLSERNSSERHSFPLHQRSIHHSGSKRRIVKPKRFEPYESFDFMDVNDRNTFSSNDTSQEDRDDDSDALRIVEDEEEDRDDGKVDSNQDQGGGDADTKTKQRKPRVMKKRKKLNFLPSALGLEEENEFDAFGRNVALQLKSLPLQDALELQIEILSLISQRRL